MTLSDRISTEDARLSDDEAVKLAKAIENRLVWGKNFWKPLHDRMDLWLNMYLLFDLAQQAKPLGFRRYCSNDPRTSVDSGVSILTRNRAFWKIEMPEGIPKDERKTIGKIERALDGIVGDMDELFTDRLEMTFWEQVAWFALMRGWIWGKFHVTKAALDAGRTSPLLAEMWDPRMVYPTSDGIGLANVLVEKHTTLAELLMQYPEKFEQNPDETDLNTPALKLEYWSNTRGEREGVTGVLALWDVGTTTSGEILPAVEMIRGQNKVWLIDPYRHGYSPEQLPVVGTPVNGIPIKRKPDTGPQVADSYVQRADRLGLRPPSWHDPAGWVAETGRGLLSAVEEQIPQFNEVMATVLQHFSINTFGQWAFFTESGELPRWEEGMNAKIPLHIGEEVRRFEPSPLNADAYRILDLIQREKEKGTISAILQASSATPNTGVIMNQIIQTALNALDPFAKGMGNFGTVMSAHILEQLRAEDFGTLSLVARTSRSYFRIEFDPKKDLGERKYKPRPIFKPALPEDMFIKAQTARILLDPRRPVMSLVSVLEDVLQRDDPEGEANRIFADIANLDPVLVLERVAQALEEEGEDDLAVQVRGNEFKAAFMKEFNFRQMVGAAQGGGVPAGGPETGSPAATGGGVGRPGQGQEAGPPGVSGQQVMP